MKAITGLIGREELVEKVVQEVRKGRHVILAGTVGVGKSAILEAVIAQLERRRGERLKMDAESDELPGEADAREEQHRHQERRQRRTLTVVYIGDHQPKAQFVCIARRLLAVGILSAESLELPEQYHSLPPQSLPWAKIKRQVNRLSMRDLTAAIIPALHDHKGQVIIAVDDLTPLTPTLAAFWLVVFDKAQVIGCVSEKKKPLARLWWKMTEIEVPPLSPEAATALVRCYIQKTGMLIEAPELYVSHVVKQAGGNPQAIADMLSDSAKEKLVDKRKIRELQHAAGVRYLDFTPVMIVALALLVGARYLAIGLGDTALYMLAGMVAALVFSLRAFLFRGAGKAN